MLSIPLIVIENITGSDIFILTMAIDPGKTDNLIHHSDQDSNFL
jgi:hypothetical protein